MSDFIHELLFVLIPSIAVISLREVIALIIKYFKVPVEVRKIKQHNKHQEKANKIKLQIKTKNEKETLQNGKENN